MIPHGLHLPRQARRAHGQRADIPRADSQVERLAIGLDGTIRAEASTNHLCQSHAATSEQYVVCRYVRFDRNRDDVSQ